MSENLNIDVAAMLNQLPPEMQKQMQTFINIMKGGQNAVVPQAGPQKKNFESLYKKDYSCITSKEDILSDGLYDEVYGGLYEDYPGSKTVARADISTVEYILSEKAKAIGGTELQRFFKRRSSEERKRRKKEYEEKRRKNAGTAMDLAVQTDFSDLPEFSTGNKFVSPEWHADNNSIYTLEERGQQTKILKASDHPILINRELRAIDGSDKNNKRVELLLKPDDKWITEIVALADLYDPRTASKILNGLGMELTPDMITPMIKYLQSMSVESRKRGALDTVETVSTLGWSEDKKRFLPYTNSGFIFDRESEFPTLIKALTPAGDREAYYQKMRELRASGQVHLNFAIAAALCSPILGMLTEHPEGFICNIYGKSRTGKSVASKIATAMFGDWRPKSGYVCGPNNTVNAMEILMNVLKSVPLIIEDTNNMSKYQQGQLQVLIMKIAGGIGKARATKTLSLVIPMAWTIAALVTSEYHITKQCGNGGSINRVLSCSSPKVYPKCAPWSSESGVPMAKQITAFFVENRGWAGIDYIKILQTLGEKGVNQIIDKKMEELSLELEKAGKPNSQLSVLAILATADELAAEYLFKDHIKMSVAELLSFVENDSEIDQNERSYNMLEDRISINAERFEGLSRIDMKVIDGREREIQAGVEQRGENWGIYHDYEYDETRKRMIKWVAIKYEVLKKWIVEEDDGDIKMFLDYLREKDLLIADKNKNTTKVYSERFGMRLSYVKIILTDGEEEVKEEKKEEKKEPKKQDSFMKAADDLISMRDKKETAEDEFIGDDEDIPFF